MKHIFFIHSHIVRAVAEAYVRQAGLQEKDCIFYLTRGLESYAAPLPGRVLNKPLPNPIFGKTTKIFKSWGILKQNALKIGEWMEQDPFITYTPNPSLPISQQLIHHPLCRGYWILEEGVGSYYTRGEASVDKEKAEKPFKFLRNIKANVLGMGVIRSVEHLGQIWPYKYHGTIASYPDCFPGYPGERVCLPTSVFCPAESPSFNHLLIIESGIGTRMDPQRDRRCYLAALQEIVAKVQFKYPGSWAWKFHPYDLENPDYCELVRELMHKHASPPAPLELPPTACVEELGISPGVTTYSAWSSAGFYIARGGGNVVNVSDVVRRAEPSFLPGYDSIPVNLQFGMPFDEFVK